MRWLIAATIGFGMCVSSSVAHGQKAKIDSILVTLPRPKAEAIDLVLAAFAENGLDVTDNSGSTIESDQEGSTNVLTGERFSRVVRALVLGKDSTSSKVLITGMEVREDSDGKVYKRLRIDNKAGGNGEKLWCRMVSVGMALDSAQVPGEARKPDKCKKN